MHHSSFKFLSVSPITNPFRSLFTECENFSCCNKLSELLYAGWFSHHLLPFFLVWSNAWWELFTYILDRSCGVPHRLPRNVVCWCVKCRTIWPSVFPAREQYVSFGEWYVYRRVFSLSLARRVAIMFSHLHSVGLQGMFTLFIIAEIFFGDVTL